MEKYLDKNSVLRLLKGVKTQIDKSKTSILNTKGAANGIASLDEKGNVPLSQLGNLDTDIYEVAPTFPGQLTEKQSKHIFLIPRDSDETTKNVYKEYIFVGNDITNVKDTDWEQLGEFTTSVDLKNYSKKNETVTSISITGEDSSGSFSLYSQNLRIDAADGTYKVVDIPLAKAGLINSVRPNPGKNGFMSADDKRKLDKIDLNALTTSITAANTAADNTNNAIQAAETATAGAEKVDATITEENIFEVTDRTGTKKSLDMSGLVSAKDTIKELQNSKIDKTSILQETGESEDKVMSQKAVSDKLSDLLEDIHNTNIQQANNIATLQSKVDTIKIATTTSDSSAIWAFNKAIKPKSKVFARLVTDAEISNSTCYFGETKTQIKLSKNYQMLDFTNYETDNFRVYLNTESAASVTLEYFMYSDLLNFAFEFEKLNKKVTEIDVLSSQINTIKVNESYTGNGAIWAFSKAIKPKSKVFARLVTELNFTSAGCFWNGTSRKVSLTKNFKLFDFSDCESDSFAVYFNAPENGNVELEYFMYSDLIEYVSQIEKINEEVDNAKLKIDNLNQQIEFPVNLMYRGYHNMIPIKIKKDGKGDFTEIQEAINSITDASPNKQYDIQVYDDVIISDLTKLYTFEGNKNTNDGINAPISEQLAIFTTKNWVNVRGVGRKVKLKITSPKNLLGQCFQYIQCVFLNGNSIVSNFDVSIEGGRYGIHQESGGNKLSEDYHATTILDNVDVVHHGNNDYVNGSSWTSTHAQANGMNSGQKMIYRNCSWFSYTQQPFYIHGNADFDSPSSVVFENCSMASAKNIGLNAATPYIGDMGGNQNINVTIIGCNFQHFIGYRCPKTRGTEKERIYDDIRYGGVIMHGHSNAKMNINQRNINALSFSTKDNGKSIDVVGGTVKDVLFGNVYKKWNGTTNAVGQIIGTRKIFDYNAQWGTNISTNVYSLAYRLGNCKGQPKTLVISIDETEHTINFNKNYMKEDGSDYTIYDKPFMSNQEIVNDINEQISEYAECSVEPFDGMKYFDDFERIVYNTTNEAFMPFDFLTQNAEIFNKANSATAGKDIVGIAAERINPKEHGRIILLGNSYIPHVGSEGTYYKVNNNAQLEETSNKDEAIFKQIDWSVIDKLWTLSR